MAECIEREAAVMRLMQDGCSDCPLIAVGGLG